MALCKKKNSPIGYLPLILLLAGLHGLGMGPGLSKKQGPECKADRFIQAEGAVPKPGVYALCAGENLAALLHRTGYEGASSFPDDAAGRLISGGRVIIKKSKESQIVITDEMSAFYKLTLAIPLSLNHESEEGLCAVPGIGPGLARKIVVERTKRGGFREVSELRSVKGIGPKKLEKFRPFLTL